MGNEQRQASGGCSLLSPWPGEHAQKLNQRGSRKEGGGAPTGTWSHGSSGLQHFSGEETGNQSSGRQGEPRRTSAGRSASSKSEGACHLSLIHPHQILDLCWGWKGAQKNLREARTNRAGAAGFAVPLGSNGGVPSRCTPSQNSRGQRHAEAGRTGSHKRHGRVLGGKSGWPLVPPAREGGPCGKEGPAAHGRSRRG